MAQTSVVQFAGELKVPPAVLLEQLQAAGVGRRMADDILSEQDKTKLLEYLRKSHGSVEPKTKITLTRRQSSEIIKKSDTSGKARTIQVEVKKKRVFVRRDAPEPASIAEPALVEAPAPVVDEREVALRQQEQEREHELAARQAAEVAEKQERERRQAEQREAELKKATEASAPAAPAADTTLHKPKAAEPGAKTEKKAKKKEVTVWKDDSVKRRAIKTRGEVQGASGWHNPKGSARHRADAREALPAQPIGPAEPSVREVHVPETIT
ncbi:MAG: translation initiation factor IF-2 associated domain-containing protein, partial [Burkholderiales bacterium]|nr:translation initiation factor IF-2 associated domain-containing protein [Burkholderiales bacterium]